MKKYAFLTVLCSGVILAQPQGRVLWSHHGTDGIYNSVTIQDLDGDTLPEVVAVIYYSNHPSDPRKVYCLSGRTGDSIWISRTAYGTWGNKALGVSPDLSGDGIEDVILGTPGGTVVPGRSCIAIHGLTGDTLWAYSRGTGWGWVYTVKSFVDIDGDGFPDVLAASGSTPGTAILLSGKTGDSIWAFRVRYDAAQCIAPFDDINADSVPDVLLGAGGNGTDNRIFCLSGQTGDSLWAYRTDNSVQDIELLRDVNGSGTNDCVAGGWADSVYCIEGSTGSLIWAADIGRVVMELVPVHDINGDAIDDVIVGSWDSNVHVLSGTDGSFIWTGAVGSDVWSVDTLADVTGDNIPEVVAGGLNGKNVKVFNGATGQELWYYNFNERVYDVTGAPDLNGDGRADVIVGLQDQGNEPDHLFCFDGGPPSGIEIEPTHLLPDSPAMLAFDPRSRTLSLQVPVGASYRLNLLDVLGRSAIPPVSGRSLDAGPIRVALDGLPAGTYFANLSLSHGRANTLKLVLLTQRRQ